MADAEPCAIPDGALPTGSQGDIGPYPRGNQPAFTVEGDPDSGWKPSDDVTPDLPPPPGGPVVTPPTGDLDPDGYPVMTFEEVSLLCNDIGLSPEIVEGIIVQLLRQHFSDPANFIYTELSKYIWTADPQTRRLEIVEVNQWSEVGADKLPGIVYADLGSQNTRLAIGDSFYVDTLRGTESFARGVSGSHRLMCIADDNYVAGKLADEVQRWLMEFSPKIRDQLLFHDFQVTDRAQAQPFAQLGNRIGVALVVRYQYVLAWELAPAGPPLKSVGPLPSA